MAIQRFQPISGILITVILMASCMNDSRTEVQPGSAPVESVPDTGETVFGFFPSPPEITIESLFSHYRTMGKHADIVLYQNEIPWKDFAVSPDADSKLFDDMKNQMILAGQENMDGIFIIDPLNGLNRREFHHLPFGWKASFENPKVRGAFKNFALRIVREFNPEYLGLASEINTYADAYPEDFEHFLSLYREVYDAVKAESPNTRVFTTFQWEDLNNRWEQPWEQDYAPGTIKWHQIEAFEPFLDLWAISSYPYTGFNTLADIPPDYYSPLLARTDKPLAVAEGGWISEDIGHLNGSNEDQIGYLEAIQEQIGSRMAFWVYLLARDISIESYSEYVKGQDLQTLELFTTVGLISLDGEAKPALEYWDSLRTGN